MRRNIFKKAALLLEGYCKTIQTSASDQIRFFHNGVLPKSPGKALEKIWQFPELARKRICKVSRTQAGLAVKKDQNGEAWTHARLGFL